VPIAHWSSEWSNVLDADVVMFFKILLKLLVDVPTSFAAPKEKLVSWRRLLPSTMFDKAG
jgi:hypothetical protein